MNYNRILKKYLPSNVSKVTVTKFSPKKRYHAKTLKDGTYFLRIPEAVNLCTLALGLHEFGHVKYPTRGHIHSTEIGATSFDAEILRLSPQIDSEERAWKYALTVFRKERITITKDLLRFIQNCLDTYIICAIDSAAHSVYFYGVTPDMTREDIIDKLAQLKLEKEQFYLSLKKEKTDSMPWWCIKASIQNLEAEIDDLKKALK